MVELRKGFHQELEALRDEVVKVAELVAGQIVRVTDALVRYDLDLAAEIIEAEAESGASARELEERCYRLLALQAPVASDLRQIVALIKMIFDIGRAGELVVNIAKATTKVGESDISPSMLELFAEMGKQANLLFIAALDALRSNDVEKANILDDLDSRLDALQKQVIQTILEQHGGGKADLRLAIREAMVARFYERIGDHAVQIGERVRYMLTGMV